MPQTAYIFILALSGASHKKANAKPHAQVVISAPSKLAAPLSQDLTTPANYYALFQHAVKQDSNKVIVVILKYSMLAKTALGLCATTKAFPGISVDHAQFLGSAG